LSEDKAGVSVPYCEWPQDQPQPTMTTESTGAASAQVSSLLPSPLAPNALALTTWAIEPRTAAVTRPRVTVHNEPV
jgi:hypothetical protein